MDGPVSEDDEEIGPGFELEEICFDLLLAGVPREIIYGWHDGWDFDRLVRLFLHVRRRKIEGHREGVQQVALGAGALFSKKGLDEFNKSTDKQLGKLSNRSGDFGVDSESSKRAQKEKDVENFMKLFGSLGTPKKKKS